MKHHKQKTHPRHKQIDTKARGIRMELTKLGLLEQVQGTDGRNTAFRLTEEAKEMLRRDEGES